MEKNLVNQIGETIWWSRTMSTFSRLVRPVHKVCAAPLAIWYRTVELTNRTRPPAPPPPPSSGGSHRWSEDARPPIRLLSSSKLWIPADDKPPPTWKTKIFFENKPETEIKSNNCVNSSGSCNVKMTADVSSWLTWKSLVRRTPFSKNEDLADSVYKVNGL